MFEIESGNVRGKEATANRNEIAKVDALTRTFVTWAVENKVSKVFIGNPEGVQRKKRRRIVSQKLSLWNFGKHLE